MDGSFYTGQCKNLSDRVSRHNNCNNKSTKTKIPWQLVYYEKYTTRNEAVQRELEIKKQKSRNYIEGLISEFPKDKIEGL
jgi:putative endonuclease